MPLVTIDDQQRLTINISVKALRSDGFQHYCDYLPPSAPDHVRITGAGRYRKVTGQVHQLQLFALHLEMEDFHDKTARHIRKCIAYAAGEGMLPLSKEVYQELEAGAVAVNNTWQLGNEPPLSDDDTGVLEHLIHEVAHAVDLDLLPFNELTSARIGSTCLTLGHAKAVEAEARVWAISWHVWKQIGLDKRYEWGDVLNAGEIQMVEEFQIEAALRDANVADQAAKTLTEVKRLCGTGALR